VNLEFSAWGDIMNKDVKQSIRLSQKASPHIYKYNPSLVPIPGLIHQDMKLLLIGSEALQILESQWHVRNRGGREAA
jgi:hypothetical protein